MKEFIQELIEKSCQRKINREILAVFNDNRIITLSHFSSKSDIENALQNVDDNPQDKLSGRI
jgi:hypothetical protein